ncbi:DUF2189 domain-containing protein [Rhodobacter sp.]
MQQDTAGSRPMPEIMQLDLTDLRAALAAGARDFLRAPLFGLFFAGVYVGGGWLIVWASLTEGQIWWTIFAGAGFPILGPFIACGFYEVSRRLETGEALDWRGVLGAIFRQKDRQIPTMAAIIVVFFLFWNFLAHMIFALFLGTATLTNITSSLQVFLTGEGLAMLAFGTVIGAIFAGLLFALTVVSLPMLMDRDVDFITAMIASWSLVAANPGVMALWAAAIALSLFLGMATGFLGLFIALPLFGHASWHLYRRALE